MGSLKVKSKVLLLSGYHFTTKCVAAKLEDGLDLERVNKKVGNNENKNKKTRII